MVLPRKSRLPCLSLCCSRFAFRLQTSHTVHGIEEGNSGLVSLMQITSLASLAWMLSYAMTKWAAYKVRTNNISLDREHGFHAPREPALLVFLQRAGHRVRWVGRDVLGREAGLGRLPHAAALPWIRQSNQPTCSELLWFLQELRAWVAPWPEAWILVRRCGGGGSAVDGDQAMEYCALKGLAPFLKGWIRSLDSSLTHMPFLLT